MDINNIISARAAVSSSVHVFSSKGRPREDCRSMDDRELGDRSFDIYYKADLIDTDRSRNLGSLSMKKTTTSHVV